MTRQLDLDWDGLGPIERARRQLLTDAREVVGFVGLKQVAFDLDQRPSSISNALACRDRHYLRLDALPYLVARAPSDDIVTHLAELRGLRVELAPMPTPEEQLRALLGVLEESLGPELRAAVLSRAKRKARGG